MKRIATVVAGVVISAGALTGCGGGNEYCDNVSDVEAQFSDIEGDDATLGDFQDAVDGFEDISASAPDDIKSEWESVTETLSSLVDALEEVDVDEDASLQEAMGSIDPADAEGLVEVLGDLQTVDADMEKISTQVEEECDIEMG